MSGQETETEDGEHQTSCYGGPPADPRRNLADQYEDGDREERPSDDRSEDPDGASPLRDAVGYYCVPLTPAATADSFVRPITALDNTGRRVRVETKSLAGKSGNVEKQETDTNAGNGKSDEWFLYVCMYVEGRGCDLSVWVAQTD